MKALAILGSRSGGQTEKATQGLIDGLSAKGVETEKLFLPEMDLESCRQCERDGWGICARLRQISDVPILMLSALGGDSHVVRGLKGGADDYLGKPFADDVLVAPVEALLRRPTLSSSPA